MSKKSVSKSGLEEIRSNLRSVPNNTSKGSFNQNQFYYDFFHSVLTTEAEEELLHPLAYSIPEYVQKFLIENGVVSKNQNSEKNSSNRYECRLCKFRLTSLKDVLKHSGTKYHLKRKDDRDLDETLHRLPPPTANHAMKIKSFLEQNEKNQALTLKDLEIRSTVAQRINNLVETNFEGCHVFLYGSSLTGFGLKASDVNLCLATPDPKKDVQILRGVCKLIQDSEENFRDVKWKSESKFPAVTFISGCFKCVLTTGTKTFVETSLLLRDYFKMDRRVKTLSASLRLWARVCQIDNQESGTLPAHVYAILLVFFLQQLDPPVLPCLHTSFKNFDSTNYENGLNDQVSSFKSRNKLEADALWVLFFQFFAVKFQVPATIVSVRKLGGISKNGTKWSGKKLTIEDPFCRQHAVTSSVEGRNLDFVSHCFKNSYIYFGVAQTEKGPAIKRISSLQINYEEVYWKVGGYDYFCGYRMPLGSFFGGKKLDLGRCISVRESKRLKKQISAEKLLNFELKRSVLTGGKTPNKTCELCDSKDHPLVDCPLTIPSTRPSLKALTNRQTEILNELCQQVYDQNKPSPDELKTRQVILQKLTAYIRSNVFANSILTLFGSSCNGFGFKQSDMDICLTFFGQDDVCDASKFIKILDKQLRNMKGIRDVLAIPAAKVPIVKFRHNDSGIEGDICIYNTLAMENTKLIKTYSLIDDRAKILGYMVKTLAKNCDIADASRGTLSSYAYLLMTIHYLQQRSPPVLPVLQELHLGDKKTQKLAEGKDVSFFSDIQKLKDVWPRYKENKESLAELWVGFLDYYVYVFDDKNEVVTIRQKDRLTKSEKEWLLKPFAIEDPFDLDHNLGVGLSKKMFLFIKKTLANAREHFATFDPESDKNIKNHLLKFDVLLPCKLPNDRGCHHCGNVQHMVKNCPKLHQNGTKKEDSAPAKAGNSNVKPILPKVEKLSNGAPPLHSSKSPSLTTSTTSDHGNSKGSSKERHNSGLPSSKNPQNEKPNVVSNNKTSDVKLSKKAKKRLREKIDQSSLPAVSSTNVTMATSAVNQKKKRKRSSKKKEQKKIASEAQAQLCYNLLQDRSIMKLVEEYELIKFEPLVSERSENK